MGIVVTFFMLVLLLLSTQKPLHHYLEKAQLPLSILALCAGLWNVFWYGAQHMGELWGNMALISGLFMIITSLPLITFRFFQQLAQSLPKVVFTASRIGLMVCAAYYAYTLVLLNI